MTTAWSHLVRGELMSASRANLSGALLGVAACIASPWCLASAAFGHWWPVRPRESVLLPAVVALGLVTGVDWVLRMLVLP